MVLRVCTPDEFPTGLRCANCYRLIAYPEPYTAQFIEFGGECDETCPPTERCIRHADVAQIVCIECGSVSPLADGSVGGRRVG